MSKDFPTLSLDEILNGRKLPQKSIPICMRLDIMADIEELERAIQAAQGNAVDDVRMTGTESDVESLTEKIRELEAIGRQYTVDLRIQALDRKEWAAQVAEASTEDDDGNSKLNLSDLTANVLALPGVILAPEMTADQRDRFLAGLSDGQWETVMQGTFNLNRRTVTVGKSLTASLATPSKNAKPGPVAQ